MASPIRQRIEQQDRRSGHRYPMKVDIAYRVVLRNQSVMTGVGQTINISSGGVLLETPDPLASKQKIELSVFWPVRLDNVTPLQLHITGQTVRTEGTGTAVTIERHEFRTRGCENLRATGESARIVDRWLRA